MMILLTWVAVGWLLGSVSAFALLVAWGHAINRRKQRAAQAAMTKAFVGGIAQGIARSMVREQAQKPASDRVH